MNKLPILLLVLVLAWLDHQALADQIALGAAYVCDANTARFALMADVDAEDPKAGVFADADESPVTRLKEGTHHLLCNWEGVKISVDVGVWPADVGMCEGAGGARFSHLTVNGWTYASSVIDFHDFPSCAGDFALIGVVVKQTPSGPKISTCTGPGWNWDHGWRDVTCVTEGIADLTLTADQLNAVSSALCEHSYICLTEEQQTTLVDSAPRDVSDLISAVYKTQGHGALDGPDAVNDRIVVLHALQGTRESSDK
jgi:hypothetical protein